MCHVAAQTGSQGPQEAAQGKNAWMLKMSEWAPHTATGTLQAAKSGAASTFDPSAAPDHHGHNTAHIIVYDRKSKRLVEEIISPHLILAMRKIYQSRVRSLIIARPTKIWSARAPRATETRSCMPPNRSRIEKGYTCPASLLCASAAEP